jgi:hypothetical protein
MTSRSFFYPKPNANAAPVHLDTRLARPVRAIPDRKVIARPSTRVEAVQAIQRSIHEVNSGRHQMPECDKAWWIREQERRMGEIRALDGASLPS